MRLTPEMRRLRRQSWRPLQRKQHSRSRHARGRLLRRGLRTRHVRKAHTGTYEAHQHPAAGYRRGRRTRDNHRTPHRGWESDRSRCMCRLLPQTVLPSPYFGRVGVHNFPFEACSGFIRITARQFARPPKAAFVAGLRSSQLPNHTACQLPGQPTITRVGLSPTSTSRRN